MDKKISVIIPLYNHEKYICFAIDSVLNQTYKNFEIIIIDDGSTDNSFEKAQEYQAKYPDKIQLLKQENQGAHNTINRGIYLATGEYIAILNSDDIFKSYKLERCIEIMRKNPEINLIFGKVEFIDEDNNIIKSGTPIDWQKRGMKFLDESNLFLLSMMNENIITTTSNIFFRKNIINNKLKFYPLRYCHDLDFILSCSKNNKYYFDRDNMHISYRYHTSNTIKENIKNIQLEIAAVIGVSLAENKTEIINKKIENIKYLAEFLNNKNISNTIIYFIMFYLENPDKDTFYDYIYAKENKEKLIGLLN